MPETSPQGVETDAEAAGSVIFFENERVTPRDFRLMGFLRSLCSPHEVNNHSLDLSRICDAITYQGFRRWSSEEINSAVCGHVLVTLSILLNATAFFFGVVLINGNPELALFGTMLGLLALAFGWLVIRSEAFRIPAIVFTMASYAFLLVWAWNVTR